MAKFTVVRTTREYETIFIIRADANEEERKRVFDRIDKVMDTLDGHILQRDDWGKRKLSYRMKKHSHGVYYYYRYLAYGDLVAELERNFRLLEPVLKFLTVKLGDDLDRDARIAEDQEAAAAAASAQEAAEAEVEAEADVKVAAAAE